MRGGGFFTYPMDICTPTAQFGLVTWKVDRDRNAVHHTDLNVFRSYHSWHFKKTKTKIKKYV